MLRRATREQTGVAPPEGDGDAANDAQVVGTVAAGVAPPEDDGDAADDAQEGGWGAGWRDWPQDVRRSSRQAWPRGERLSGRRDWPQDVRRSSRQA